MNSQTLMWWAGTLTKRLGLWGVLGMLLLIGSAVMYWVKIPAVAAEIQRVEHELANLDQARANKIKKRDLALDPAKQDAKVAAQFYTRFPQLNGVPDLLRSLHQLAKGQRLRLEVGDYRYQKARSRRQAAAQKVTQYKMIFPVEGQYPNIRKFIEQALAKHPALALLDIQVVRDNRKASMVAARIVFAVYVKEAA